MKKILIAAMLICCTAMICSAQNKDRRKSFKSWENYEVTTEKVGVEGTKFIKVWGFGRTVDKAVMSAKRNAVHACLFKGLPGGATANATPAIVRDPDGYANNQEYFDDFFAAGGPYLGYINITTDGIPSGQDRRKVQGGYKVALYVQVMYDRLKEKMINDGITKGLSYGF